MTTTPRSFIAERADYGLQLAANFQPDVDTVLLEGMAGYGIKGSGKTTVAALVAEQMGRYYLPQVIFDLEGEYGSLINALPNGVLASCRRLPSGEEILERGLQVVVQLRSWDNDQAAALAMCQLLSELRQASANLPPQDRVPCLLILDEAQYWLPQRAVGYLDKEVAKQLRDEWMSISTRGRKLGLSPAYFTQRISEVNKGVVSQAGIQILMRQTLDRDISRYFEYITGRDKARMRSAIRGFRRGEGIVCLPDGMQLRVRFNNRATTHVSNAPRVQAALKRFRPTLVQEEVLS